MAKITTGNLALNRITFSGTNLQYIAGDGTLITFPTNISVFINDSNYITATSSNILTNKSGNISQWTNNVGYLTSINSSLIIAALGYTPLSANQTITLSGDITGSGTTTINTSLATINSNVFTSNTFLKFAVNAKGLITSANAVNSSDIISALTYTPINKAGDTMLGYLTLHADPTNPLHATTKSYVDNLINGLS